MKAIQREKYPQTSSIVEEDDDPRKKYAYNRDGLLSALASMEETRLPFVESMVICKFSIDVPDEHDDLQREIAFYDHTLQAAHVGKVSLKTLGVPTTRPVDFFCEHMKSDAHMAKVKDRLILEEKKMDAFEKRKNRDHNKKFNKQVSEVKKQENAKRKRGEFESDSKYSRGRKMSSQDAQERDKNGTPQKSTKRIAMDKKYGRKGNPEAKRNDRKSLNDLKDFNPRGGRLNRRPNGAKKPNRPGKASRDQKRKNAKTG